MYITGYIEENYCLWMSFYDDEYYKNTQVRDKKGFENFRRGDLLWQQYSKKWLWILIYGDDKSKCSQLDTLHAMLKRDVKRYIWFANQAQKCSNY